MATPNPLPFQFSKRWPMLRHLTGFATTLTLMLEERDRELEDFLGVQRAKIPDSSAAVILRNSGGFSVPNNAATPIPLDIEVWDPLGMHTGVSTFFTVPQGKGGVWLVTACVQFASAAGGYRSGVVSIGSNAAGEGNEAYQWGGDMAATTSNQGEPWSKHCLLASGATVQLQGVQTSGAALATNLDTWLTAHLVTPIDGI